MKRKYLSEKIIKDKSSFSLIKDLYSYLSKRRKKQLFFLLILNLFSSLSESISLGALFPLLGILLNPNKINGILPDFLISILPTDNPRLTLITVTVIFISFSLISSMLRLFSLWLNGRVAAAIGSDLGYESFKKVLNSSYATYLLMDSNKNISTLSVHLNFTVIAINSFLKLITFALISIAIISFLLYFDFFSAISAGLVLSFSYLLLIKFYRRKLIKNSYKISNFTKNQISLMRESFAFIKEIILDTSQNKYTNSYKNIDINMRKLQAQNVFIGISPRYIMESIGISFIACLALSLSLRSNEALLVIPTLGTIALGAQKLLPSIQQVYSSWAILKGHNSDMNNVLELLRISPENVDYFLAGRQNKKEKNIFRQSLRFEKVSFSYSKDKPLILKDLNFTIYKGERIGIIGSTGSGKSTLLDLLLTFLSPNEGKIFVDDIELSNIDQIINWRSCISNVPQSVFLLNDSIANNIALTSNGDKKNYSRILDAADKAQILNYCNSLRQKFETHVGENGVNLSGGQRQRIGIARALYKKSKIIVLDEATSALDINTENSVINSISKISREITVIMVTHRLKSLKNFDRVIMLKDGRIEKIGLPNEILKDY